MQKLEDKECCIAELDSYCDDLYENKLTKSKIARTKEIFKIFPDLKKEFPKLNKVIK